MRRFFVPSDAIADGVVRIAGRDARHIVRALRMGPGDRLSSTLPRSRSLTLSFSGSAISSATSRSKAYWTGPSSSYQLQEKDPEVTRQAVRTCLEVFGKTGFIYCLIVLFILFLIARRIAGQPADVAVIVVSSDAEVQRTATRAGVRRMTPRELGAELARGPDDERAAQALDSARDSTRMRSRLEDKVDPETLRRLEDLRDKPG